MRHVIYDDVACVWIWPHASSARVYEVPDECLVDDDKLRELLTDDDLAAETVNYPVALAAQESEVVALRREREDNFVALDAANRRVAAGAAPSRDAEERADVANERAETATSANSGLRDEVNRLEQAVAMWSGAAAQLRRRLVAELIGMGLDFDDLVSGARLAGQPGSSTPEQTKHFRWSPESVGAVGA